MTGWDPITVNTDHPYQVLLGHGVVGLLPSFLDKAQRVAVVHPAPLADIAQNLRVGINTEIPNTEVLLIEVPDAEAAKTPAVLAHCWTMLAQAGFTRSDVVVGLGGGATTDLAGFVAATWLRGVRYLAVPTTVLAMVDAAVGGKTGINLPAGKNLVGAFYEPVAVLGDLDLIATLPVRELRSGFAEVLKCGFIADPAILDGIKADPMASQTISTHSGELMRRAIVVKAQVVASDLHERTSATNNVGREALNYGHTLGHAIERNEGFGWRHGEAVSVGMVFAAEVAHRAGLIEADLLALHRQVLQQSGLPTTYAGASWTTLRKTMQLDKKTRGDQLRLVVLDRLGHPRILIDPAADLLAEAFLALEPSRSG